MKKIIPLTIMAVLPTMMATTVHAEALQSNKFHVGAAISHNMIDSPFDNGSGISASGFSLLVGYEFDNKMPLVKTSIEVGFDKTGDFTSDENSDISGVWIAGVLEKDLPELNKNLFVLARGGVDLGDDDGILLGVGAGFHISKELDVRAEYISKDTSSVLQLGVAFHF